MILTGKLSKFYIKAVFTAKNKVFKFQLNGLKMCSSELILHK